MYVNTLLRKSGRFLSGGVNILNGCTAASLGLVYLLPKYLMIMLNAPRGVLVCNAAATQRVFLYRDLYPSTLVTRYVSHTNIRVIGH